MSPITVARAPTGCQRTILTAVAAGHAELTRRCEPDLFVDRLCCCDRVTAHHLAHTGLITTTGGAKASTRRAAVLTTADETALASNLVRPPTVPV